jgi:hypothetical protein
MIVGSTYVNRLLIYAVKIGTIKFIFTEYKIKFLLF